MIYYYDGVIKVIRIRSSLNPTTKQKENHAGGSLNQSSEDKRGTSIII